MSLPVGFSKVVGAANTRCIVGNQWFGNGSDGVGEISHAYEVPVAEDLGHIFLQYRSLTIKNGGILRPSARCAGMVILVQGDCKIEAGGTISMDKMAPRLSADTEAAIKTTGPSSHIIQLTSSLTGGRGGNGESKNSANAGVGGNGFWCGGGYGGGGTGYGTHTVSGVWTSENGTTTRNYNGGSSEPRPPVTALWPPSVGYGAGGGVYGGLGPGGGGSNTVRSQYYSFFNGEDSHGGYRLDTDNTTGTYGEHGDAYGGGALWLVVGGRLTVNGTITARGGNGGGGYTGGGGGGGGIIALLYHRGIVLGDSSQVLVSGGAKGGSASNGANGTLLSAKIALDGTIAN